MLGECVWWGYTCFVHPKSLYGLLLYIEKVFKWRHTRNNTPPKPPTAKTKPKAQEALMLSLLARKTLNNVTACRRSGND
jgi:hypothetical protein